MKKTLIMMAFPALGIISLTNAAEASTAPKCDFKLIDLNKPFNPEPNGAEGGRIQYITSVAFIIECVHKDGMAVPATVKFSEEKCSAASKEEARAFIRAEAVRRAFKELKEQCRPKKCDGEERPKK